MVDQLADHFRRHAAPQLERLARLEAGLLKIIEGGYAPGADIAHPSIGLARDTLNPKWRQEALARAESHYPALASSNTKET